MRIATARAGNVIGGGDWSPDRIVPDAMRFLACGESISVRNPLATRPWQHVIEPLAGYLKLAEVLATESNPPCEAFNFGPVLSSNRSVSQLVNTIIETWPGKWHCDSDTQSVHEANLLHLQIDKSYHCLGWRPYWDFATTVRRTVSWYRSHYNGADAFECCLADLKAYTSNFSNFMNEPNKLKAEILRLTREYSRQVHGAFLPALDPNRQAWEEGDAIPYAGRVFNEEEVEAAVSATLDFWLTLGKEGHAFQKELAAFLGVRHSLLVNSGSSANLIAISALTSPKLPEDRRIHPWDEVITVAAGFPTTVSPIVQIGAVPVFIDANTVTGNACCDQLEAAYRKGKRKL